MRNGVLVLFLMLTPFVKSGACREYDGILPVPRRKVPRRKISVRGGDRRRHPPIRCFVAVELHVDDSPNSLWGNLSNTSAAGCLVETANPVPRWRSACGCRRAESGFKALRWPASCPALRGRMGAHSL
jgi:hypothetical protein